MTFKVMLQALREGYEFYQCYYLAYLFQKYEAKFTCSQNIKVTCTIAR